MGVSNRSLQTGSGRDRQTGSDAPGAFALPARPPGANALSSSDTSGPRWEISSSNTVPYF
ncbi:hypothetical protein AVEN_204955-1, partial [Araneus ventricosus]